MKRIRRDARRRTDMQALRSLVRSAIERIRYAQEHYQAVQDSPGWLSGDRLVAKRSFDAAIAAFALQWKNVEAVLDAETTIED